MMLTPALLVIVLRNMGYPVTERRLTDWRAKGLLPALKLVGRGNGKGILRYWSESNIVGRAVHVLRQLRDTRSAKKALVQLFCDGFGCSENRVRAALVAGTSRRRGERSIRKTEGQLARITGQPRPSSVGDVLVEVWDIFTDPDWSPDARIDFQCVVDLFNACIRVMSGKMYAVPFSRKMLLAAAFEMRTWLSSVAFRSIAARASDREIRRARREWSRVKTTLDGLDSIGLHGISSMIRRWGPSMLRLFLPAPEAT